MGSLRYFVTDHIVYQYDDEYCGLQLCCNLVDSFLLHLHIDSEHIDVCFVVANSCIECPSFDTVAVGDGHQIGE